MDSASSKDVPVKGGSAPPVLIPLDRAKVLWFLVACLGFVAAGIELFRSTHGVMHVLNGLVVGVAAIAAGVFVFLLVRGRRVAVRVTDVGIEDRTHPWRATLVPWHDLAGVSQLEAPGAGSLVLLHTRANDSRGTRDVQVRAHLLKGGADAVVAAITSDPHYCARE